MPNIKTVLIRLLSGVCALAILIVVSGYFVRAASQSAVSPQNEVGRYKVERFQSYQGEPEELQDMLNHNYEEGWEFTVAIEYMSGRNLSGPTDAYLIFRKKK